MKTQLAICTPRTAADSHLERVNQKIEKLAARKPYSDVYAVFALASQLAEQAIGAVVSLEQMSGNVGKFEATLEFWHSLRDRARVAALACAGGNQTLAEALVTFRLLRNTRRKSLRPGPLKVR